MKRRATKIVLFLLLGAIINVAVAWLFALRPWSKVQETARSYVRSTKPRTTVIIATGELYLGQYGGWAWSEAYVLNETPKFVDDAQLSSHFPYWSAFAHGDPLVTQSQSPEGSRLWQYDETAFGWPAYSLFYQSAHGNGPSDRSSTAIALPDSLRQLLARNNFRFEFPRTPIFPGFAINTIFYGAILWLPVAGLGALRRRRRIKRGLCPACAYPLGESDVCTECGKA